jgi:hypothetical protein
MSVIVSTSAMLANMITVKNDERNVYVRLEK